MAYSKPAQTTTGRTSAILPLQVGQDGPTITLTAADVADTDRRRGQHE